MRLIKKMRRLFNMYRILKTEYGSIASVSHIKNEEEFLQRFNSASLKISDAIALDIGCGTHPKNPFDANCLYGVDIRENQNENIISADLTRERIPFPDNHFNYITAIDFIEHVPRIIYLPERRFAFVELMNEVWRSLKPNGIFLSRTPIYPFSQVFQDPTHVNILTDQTFPFYFDNEKQWAKMYGFHGSFEVLDQVISGIHLISILKKTKEN